MMHKIELLLDRRYILRIRRKKWAEEELRVSNFYIDKPETYKNKWKASFFNDNKLLYVEFGCGKGLFISTISSNNRNINYIAVDMIEAMLGISKRNIEKAYEFKNPDNLFLIRANIENISNVFGDKDQIDRIYINFCNPWPKNKHNKRRLTHTRQLEQYKTFLIPNGEIYFKTDDDELFEASIEYLNTSGFKIISKTYDLHNDLIFPENIETEHEKMFSNNGIKIKALIAILL